MASSPLHVLIADDAPLTRWALTRAFSACGFAARAVGDSASLLEELMRQPFDVVVSASQFGGEDASPLLLQLAHARPDMRVIALGAGDATDAAIRLCRNVTVVDQPFSVDELLKVVIAADAVASAHEEVES